MTTDERPRPLLMGAHLVSAGLVMAISTRAELAIFRGLGEFDLAPLFIMGLEIALMFQWGLYYATRSSKVRRVLRLVLTAHLALVPLLVAAMVAWPSLQGVR